MTLEEEEQIFNKKIATALAAWGGVEMHLSLLFSVLLDARNNSAKAHLVFHSIENLRSKRQVIDALASKTLSPKLYEEWKVIDKHLAARVSKRNRIAHHERLCVDFGQPGKRYGLIQPMMNPLMRDGRSKPMHIHELEEARTEFQSLKSEIRAFTSSIEAAHTAAMISRIKRSSDPEGN